MANYKFVIPYFLDKEGGKSRATTDTASSYPSPCSFNGQKGWHTNKGITWRTFVSNAHLGYTPSCENFFNMPPYIWGLIFKKAYWDFWGSDQIKQQSIADFMTWSVWGSGGGSFRNNNGSIGFLKRFLQKKGYNPKSKAEIRTIMIHLAKQNEKKLWLELIQERRNFYVRLNQPYNLNGWNNALNKYVVWGEKHYKFGRSKIKKLVVPLTILTVSGLFIYKTQYYDKRGSIAS